MSGGGALSRVQCTLESLVSHSHLLWTEHRDQLKQYSEQQYCTVHCTLHCTVRCTLQHPRSLHGIDVCDTGTKVYSLQQKFCVVLITLGDCTTLSHYNCGTAPRWLAYYNCNDCCIQTISLRAVSLALSVWFPGSICRICY